MYEMNFAVFIKYTEQQSISLKILMYRPLTFYWQLYDLV